MARKITKSAKKTKLSGKSLVESWLFVELEAKERTLKEALDELNDTLGSAHTHSRVREWEQNRNGRGERLPRSLRIVLGKKVIREVLSAAGIDLKGVSTAKLNKVVEQLS